MVVVVPVEGWLLTILLIAGAVLAVVGGLAYWLAHKERAKMVIWIGVFIAGWCGIGFLLGWITGG